MFQAACKFCLEGIVSKKLDAPYKSGPSKVWLKIKNPKAPPKQKSRAPIADQASSEEALMKLKLIVAISVLAAAPSDAWSQQPAAKVTKADAQRVLKIIQSDKAKTQIYCEKAKIGTQLERLKADSKKFAELSQKMDEMEKRLGPEYGALIDGLQDIDPRSEAGQEISNTLEALDHLCGR